MYKQLTSYKNTVSKISLIVTFLFLVVSCGKKTQIMIDGSSTVYPITEAIAEEFRKVDPKVQVTVGVSGTGGGFKKFCNGETDISDASRSIKKSEVESCVKKNIQYVEMPVAFDGLAVLVNKDNSFINTLTVEELKKIFSANTTIKTWKDLNPAWPNEKIKIYSPGQDSGTHDYFVEAIIGDKGSIRNDSTFSEDDNVLVKGIAGDKNSIGFFGLAYYEENMSTLKVVQIVNPTTKKAVTPSLETVKDGSYAPLSRPIFIYIRKDSYSRPEVKQFVQFYNKQAGKLSKDVGYIPLTDVIYSKNEENLKNF